MKDELEIKGYWWLPKTPDKKVFGELTYVPGETLKLKLQGTLKDSDSRGEPGHRDFINPRIVYGVSQGSKKITLYDCMQDGLSSTNGAIHLTSFTALAAFVGFHFSSDEGIKFKGISIQYLNLDEWANQHPFHSEKNHGDDEISEIIKYRPPSTTTAKLEGFEIQIVYWGPKSNLGRNRVELSYETRVNVVAEEEKSFEDFLDYLRRVQNFLGLIMGFPTYPLEMTGMTDANKETDIDVHLPIEIYYPVAWWPGNLDEQFFARMMFTLPLIGKDFETYFREWMAKYDLFEPVINLYFSVLYDVHGYLQVEFLSLAQAIETYHRRRFGGSYQPKDEYLGGLYEVFVDSIPAAIPGDYRDSIVGKLRYLYEYSLRRRLKEVIRSIKGELDFDFIQSREVMGIFVSKVVDTRNYLTHHTKDLEKGAVITADEFLMLITKLQIVLEVCFLKEIGFDTAQIRERITKSRRHQYLVAKVLDQSEE